SLEQAKLRLAGARPPLAGTVAIVTGAASGIGRACAAELLRRGAAVGGIDLSADVERAFAGPAWFGSAADVTDPDALRRSVHEVVEQFGGVDIAVVSAGVFGPSRAIAELRPTEWRSIMAVNLDAVADTLSVLHPLL